MLSSVCKDFAVPPCIAVNSAGIARDNFLLKLDDKSFDDVINVNLKVKMKNNNFLLNLCPLKDLVFLSIAIETTYCF